MQGRHFEVATFAVRDVVESGQLVWREGCLTVAEASFEPWWRGQPGLLGADVRVVSPGEPVRLVNVLDAVEPAVKDDASATFPGALGDLTAAGVGRSCRLDGVAVIPTADFRASHDLSKLDVRPDGDAIVDMAGPGAPYTAWSRTRNVVLSFACDPDVPLPDVDRSIRRATLGVARDLAAGVAGDATPDDVEALALAPVRGDLPAVCVILQVAAEGPLVDTYLYGRSLKGALPTVLDPREILDGALTAGQYDWAGVRNPTAFYQRSKLLLELLRAHGERLDFRGVIVTLAYLPLATDKARVAMMAAKLARQLGCRGAILTTFSSGNSQTDTMLACRACESVGIRTSVLIAETNAGLTDYVPEADAIVSVGNEEELVPEWRPDEVIGGEVLVGGQPAHDAGPLPLVSYLGSLCQVGDMNVTAVSS